MGISARIENLLEIKGGIEIRFETEQGELRLTKGVIFPGLLIEKNLYPKIGDEIELESKFGQYVIKFNGIEIGKVKSPMKGKRDK